MVKTAKKPADYILPLYMNGLQGRMLKMPSEKKPQREILLIYGHHAILERWWGLVENLNDYGNVTMPDLPGFGGMESFYKIDTRPTIDAFADYLAAFVKLRYKRKRLTIVAVSYGFVVITRMLQRYPEIADRVDLLVSMVGFMHKDDIVVNPKKQKVYKLFARFLATRPVALFIRYCCLNKFVLKNLYVRMSNSRRRMIEVTPEEFNRIMDFDLGLWQANDVRTHWLTTSEFLDLDNCQQFIALPIVHVVSEHDYYLNNIAVEQHMRQVFSDYKQFTAHTKAHVPHVLADKRAMAVLLPLGLRRLLRKRPNFKV
jgi:pimeloyl-ACP methyl ester carboxylesterase